MRLWVRPNFPLRISFWSTLTCRRALYAMFSWFTGCHGLKIIPHCNLKLSFCPIVHDFTGWHAISCVIEWWLHSSWLYWSKVKHNSEWTLIITLYLPIHHLLLTYLSCSFLSIHNATKTVIDIKTIYAVPDLRILCETKICGLHSPTALVHFMLNSIYSYGQ